MESVAIDNLLATRIIHLLITPVNQWDAYKLKIIDAKGNSLRKPTKSEEKYFNLLHVLVLKLKEIFDKSPTSNKMIKAWNAGQYFLQKPVAAAAFTSFNVMNKTLLPTAAASYYKLKECLETGQFSDTITESTISQEKLDLFLEETIGNVVGNSQGLTGEPPVSKNKILRRGEPLISFKQWAKNVKSKKSPN